MPPARILCLICSALITMQAQAEPPTRPSQVPLTDSAAVDATFPGHELSTMMTEIGVDYPVLLQKARTGDLAAMRLFVWLSHHGNLDGAAAETFCGDLDDLVKKVGDATFAGVLKGQTMPVLKAIYEYLCFGITQDDPQTRGAADAVASVFPKTLATIAALTKKKPLWK